MNVNELAAKLGDACYGFLALNFLWGLFCVILLWRRVLALRFSSEQSQAQFLGDLQATWTPATSTAQCKCARPTNGPCRNWPWRPSRTANWANPNSAN